MKIWTLHEPIRIRRPVATIGIFDGVHAGHRFILEHLKKRAVEVEGESLVVTLWPHPRLVLNKDLRGFRLLHSREEKIRKLAELGIDHLVVIPFDRQIASLTACEFVRKYLVGQLGVELLLLGYDNKFGSDMNGDPDGLARCALENRFHIEKLPEYPHSKVRVSSTAIRQAILTGELSTAAGMLGYPYFLSGQIVEGNRLGRKLGFPTANIHPDDPYKLIPLNGVYAIRAELKGRTWKGMLNIGFRPTIDSDSAVKTIEAHLLGASGDFYGEHIVIHFIRRVRDEMRFSGPDALREQLVRDRETVRGILDE